MATTLAPLAGLPVDRLASRWLMTPGMGSPDGLVGSPKPVLLMSPPIALADGAANYHAFRPGFAGTIKAVLYRVKTTGVGVGGDITLKQRINTVDLTGGSLQILVATIDTDAETGRLLAGATVTATNVFDANDEIDINLAEATAFTAGEIEVMLVVEPK